MWLEPIVIPEDCKANVFAAIFGCEAIQSIAG